MYFQTPSLSNDFQSNPQYNGVKNIKFKNSIIAVEVIIVKKERIYSFLILLLIFLVNIQSKTTTIMFIKINIITPIKSAGLQKASMAAQGAIVEIINAFDNEIYLLAINIAIKEKSRDKKLAKKGTGIWIQVNINVIAKNIPVNDIFLTSFMFCELLFIYLSNIII